MEFTWSLFPSQVIHVTAWVPCDLPDGQGTVMHVCRNECSLTGCLQRRRCRERLHQGDAVSWRWEDAVVSE